MFQIQVRTFVPYVSLDSQNTNFSEVDDIEFLFTNEMVATSKVWALSKGITDIEKKMKCYELSYTNAVSCNSYFTQSRILLGTKIVSHSTALHVRGAYPEIRKDVAQHLFFHSLPEFNTSQTPSLAIVANMFIARQNNTYLFDFGISHLDQIYNSRKPLVKQLNGHTYFKSHFSNKLNSGLVINIYSSRRELLFAGFLSLYKYSLYCLKLIRRKFE